MDLKISQKKMVFFRSNMWAYVVCELAQQGSYVGLCGTCELAQQRFFFLRYVQKDE